MVVNNVRSLVLARHHSIQIGQIEKNDMLDCDGKIR